MRSSLSIAACFWLCLAVVEVSRGQGPLPAPAAAPSPSQAADAVKQEAGKPPDPDPPQTLQEVLERTARELKALKEEHARELERQQKQAELQQKQIEVLERTTRLLADKIKQQDTARPRLEPLESKAAVLEARSQQAAPRDQELLELTNELRESLDAQAGGGQLPYTAEGAVPADPVERDPALDLRPDPGRL